MQTKPLIQKNQFIIPMSIHIRTFFLVIMSSALFFGFLHLFVPQGEIWNFQRLHIFLFNLCSGGTIILYYTQNQSSMSMTVKIFCILSISYAIFAFFKRYLPAIVIAFVLSLIVETIRIKKFSLFPTNFFKNVPVSEKFHQASLLCLSIGLTISGLVMLNNEYFKWIMVPKLQLDTFFLGFSFPISLITMSVMFSLMKETHDQKTIILKNICFWFVNLGVIIFFVFILLENIPAQVVVTSILFGTVILIFHLFIKLGIDIQQKKFLISGMVFLLATAISGIAYIILHFFPEYYTPEISKFLLRIHAFASLYGWNLSGLTVICRYSDFPILLHSRSVILLHWLTAMVLAPVGCYFQSIAILAIICYTTFLYIVFSAVLDKKKSLVIG